MTYYAILSDIHANYPALKAVESDAVEQAGNEELYYISLGDVVDYGPHPVECMNWMMDPSHKVVASIRGNHDHECSRSLLDRIVDVRKDYWPITLWTRMKLTDQHKALITSWKVSEDALQVNGLEDFMLVHGRITAITETGSLGGASGIENPSQALDQLVELSKKRKKIGLFGHMHHQVIYQLPKFRSGSTQPAAQMSVPFLPGSNYTPRIGYNYLPIDEPIPLGGGITIINPGSVGQPRPLDGSNLPRNTNARYALLHVNGRKELRFRQVFYDLENKTIPDFALIQYHTPKEDSIHHDIERERPATEVAVTSREVFEVLQQPTLLRQQKLRMVDYLRTGG